MLWAILAGHDEALPARPAERSPHRSDMGRRRSRRRPEGGGRVGATFAGRSGCGVDVRQPGRPRRGRRVRVRARVARAARRARLRPARKPRRRHFDLPGAVGTPVQYAADLGPLRLVVLDSTRPGEDRGELDAERLSWLDAELARAPDRLTLVALHHPPVSTGIPAWDEIGLPASDRRAFGDVVERHPQVRRLVAGHLHRSMTAELAGRPVLTVPSTYIRRASASPPTRSPRSPSRPVSRCTPCWKGSSPRTSSR